MSSGQNRQDISVGLEVDIVQKHHQRTNELTNGFVKRILTKSSSTHTVLKCNLRLEKLDELNIFILRTKYHE